ncbi:MAG: hypothetical protein BWZ04_02912 [Firmicutes bacterium ADurb.BinA205]|nr:MAG: hypothetical protein BWZ04_02912 [Firmicutes bacterium ADurb.BinA205]
MMVFIGVDRDNALGIINDNSSSEGKCLILDLVKALGITLVFQRNRRHIFRRRRSIRNIGGITHKVNRLFVLASVPVDNLIGNGYKVREVQVSQTVLDHILDTVKLLCIEYLAVKFVSELEIHKVSRHLNGQLIIGQSGKRKTDIVQIGEISTLTVLCFAKIVDKELCLIKRSLESMLKIHDLHGLVGVMLKHRSTQECGESGHLTVRLNLHFIATVIDTADGIAVIEQFTDLIAVSDCQFPCATLRFGRFAVSPEELVNDLL